MKILLAGGAGYIGSHIATELLEENHDVVIADNFSNSSKSVIGRIEAISGKKVRLYELDIRDANRLSDVFKEENIDCVVHLAGLKAVAESIEKPIEYYRNNIDTTLALLEVMKAYGVTNFIFSSSATVYGEENISPLFETMKKGTCSNPYGWTKSMMEQILTDAAAADPKLSMIILRYFNPIGAHESGLIGEDPKGIPNNLLPYVAQVAAGKREKLTIFGNDYDTPDGTCRRDYIHVMDLAEGHVKAVEYALAQDGCVEIFNLGTGNPYSVLEIVDAFERNSGVEIPYVFGARRPGDLPEVWANSDKAERLMGWKAHRDLNDMCRDAWNWQRHADAHA